MKPILTTLAFFLSLTLTSCGGSGPAGKWEFDMAPMRKMAEEMMAPMMAAVPADQKKAMQDKMAEQMGKMAMSLDVKADGTFMAHSDMGDKHDHISGTWKLDGEKLSMTGKSEGSEKEETMTGTVSGNTLTLDIPGPTGKSVTLTASRK